MTRRKKIIMLFIILVLAILLLLLFLLRFKSKPENILIEIPVEVIEEKIKPVSSPIQKELVEERMTTSNVQTLAKTFTERYGSFSNEADFANLRDLYPLMTKEFTLKTESFILSTTIPEAFYGVTTRVISIEIVSFDEEAGEASLILTTQREEAIDSPQNISVRYQDLQVDFVFEQGGWFVSDAQWK